MLYTLSFPPAKPVPFNNTVTIYSCGTILAFLGFKYVYFSFFPLGKFFTLFSSDIPISFVFSSKKKEACSKPASSPIPNESISSNSLSISSSIDIFSSVPDTLSNEICTLSASELLLPPSFLPAPLSSTFPLLKMAPSACVFLDNSSLMFPINCWLPRPLPSSFRLISLNDKVCCTCFSRSLSDVLLPSSRIIPPASNLLSEFPAVLGWDTTFHLLSCGTSVSFLPFVTLLSFSICLTL